MNKTMRGALLVMMGLILVAAASLIYILQDRQDQLAGQSAAILLNELRQELEHPAPITPSTPIVEAEPSEPVVSTEPVVPSEPTENDPVLMPEVTFSGYTMVGELSIPSVGIQLPILSSWDYNLLKVAPCRYSGSAEGGDLILLGHNYRSHFKPLYYAEIGATVEFVDVNGVRYSYVVDRIDTIKGTDVEKLPSGYPLSLFTCTPGGQSRLIIRCQAVASS